MQRLQSQDIRQKTDALISEDRKHERSGRHNCAVILKGKARHTERDYQEGEQPLLQQSCLASLVLSDPHLLGMRQPSNVRNWVGSGPTASGAHQSATDGWNWVASGRSIS